MQKHVISKPAETDHPIQEVLRARWSPKVFDPERSIPLGDLLSLFEAARWAPSSRNEQPWRFLVGRKEDSAAFERILGTLKESNQRWAQHASVLMVVLAKVNVRDTERANRHAWHDAGQAIAHLTVEATARGIYLRQMGGFFPELVQEAFTLPGNVEPVVAAALGYPGDLNKAEADLRERDLGPRSRHPLEAFVFGGDYGDPLGDDHTE